MSLVAAKRAKQASVRRVGLTIGVPAGVLFAVMIETGEPAHSAAVLVSWCLLLGPIGVTWYVARRKRISATRSLIWCIGGIVFGTLFPAILFTIGLLV